MLKIQQKESKVERLSRREREIMDILFRAERATASEVLAAMPDPPSYSAVRATLGILERKGLLRHEQDGTRYVYHPTVSRERAGRSAVHHLIETFFDGSIANVVAAFLEKPHRALSEDDLRRLEELIAQARKEGR